MEVLVINIDNVNGAEECLQLKVVAGMYLQHRSRRRPTSGKKMASV